MSRITQVFDYRFPAEGLTIAVVNTCFDDLVSHSELAPESWDEPGLGLTRGALIRLSSGRVIGIHELEHLVKHMNLLGAHIAVDACDVLASGVGPLVEEALFGLGLPKSAVVWSADEGLRQVAANIVEFLRARSTGSA